MFYDIFSVTDFTFCYVGPSGKYNVVKFFKNPEDWDLGPGTLDLGPWTWDLGPGTTVCLVVSLVNPGQFLTRIMDVLEREGEKNLYLEDE